jgi:hypothetical protein
MTEIKKPKWDQCGKKRGILVEGNKGVPFSAIDEPLKKGMTITGIYKGKDITMKILKETSSNVFQAEIFELETNADEYEGLAVNDIVEIHRSAVCWHQR